MIFQSGIRGGRPSMDEALEAVEFLADSGLEGAFVWILRILGAVLVIGGLALWLFTESGLLVLPAALMVVGVVLVVVPSVLLALTELFA